MKNKTEKIIERLNAYLSLTRFKYTSEEKLVRLNILRDYYESEQLKAVEENFKTPIEVEEKLSKNLILPLKVKGIMLTEGKPKARFYSGEQLKLAVENPVNKKFPIMLDHRDKEVSKIIGQVERLEYDPTIKGIRWYGHINDETFARNVMDGLITEVSATIFAVENLHPKYGKEGTNLTFKELSLVLQGAEPMNSIEVDV